MRGKAVLILDDVPGVGITPAHAGKRDGRPFPLRIYEDHPRTCGEKSSVALSMGRGLGSPPHMRGKDAGFQGLYGHPGITPAHAGKRADGAAGGQGLGDHPRTCGEKLI